MSGGEEHLAEPERQFIVAIIVGGIFEVHQPHLGRGVEHEITGQGVVHAGRQIDPGRLQCLPGTAILAVEPGMVIGPLPAQLMHLALVLVDHVEGRLGLDQQRLVVEGLECTQRPVADVAIEEVTIGRGAPALHELEDLHAVCLEKGHHRGAITGGRGLEAGIVGGTPVDEELRALSRYLEEERRRRPLDLHPPVGVGNAATDRGIVGRAAGPGLMSENRLLELPLRLGTRFA